MNILNKLTQKNLELNKKRTIVTIIGIILSVALITAVGTLYSSSIKSIIDYTKTEKGDFHIVFYNVPKDDIEIFRNNRKLESFYVTKNIGYAKIPESKNENKPYAYVKVFDDLAMKNLSKTLVEGELPKKDNEILIPTHLKTNGRVEYKIGDKIKLNVGQRVSEGEVLTQENPFLKENQEEIINSQEKEYTIVGIIERPAVTVEEYSAPGYTFITYDNNMQTDKIDIYARFTKKAMPEYYNVVADILGVNSNVLKKYYDGGMKTEKDFQDFEIEKEKSKYSTNINGYLLQLETNPIDDGAIQGLSFVVGIVCFIIVFASVYCIKNSFDISITEKTKQYGMLRSIGATKKQIRKNVLYEGSLLGWIGIPLGILLGILASFILVIVSNLLLKGAISESFKLIFELSPITILVSVLLGIITIYFSAFKSAFRASRVSPIISIRNSADIKLKRRKLRTPKFIKKIFGVGGDISYKNLKRNRKKYRTTVISIIVSVFVFISLASFIQIGFKVVDLELKHSKYNISLKFRDNKDIYDLAVNTTKLDNITEYTIERENLSYIQEPKYKDEYKNIFDEKYSDNEKEYYDGLINVISIGREPYEKYIKQLGLNYNEVKDKCILIDNIKVGKFNPETNEQTMYGNGVYSYNKGDILEVEIDEGIKHELQVAEFSDVIPMGLENQSYETVLVLVSDEKFDEINKQPNKEVMVYFNSSNPNKLQDELDILLKDKEYTLNNVAEQAQMQQNIYILACVFLYGFIIVISLIGITNVFNTITTNMELRKQEFASLKSIGMTQKEFSKMISLESIFMGVKSLVFGIVIGITLSIVIYDKLASDMGIRYSLPIIPIIISILAVFLLINIIMRSSMNKINKQNTIETIRNENI